MPTKALIPLPSVIEPELSICTQIEIPDDSEWKAMFWGALDQLTRWNSYQRNPDHDGQVVASRWKSIIATAREWDRQSACGDAVCANGIVLDYDTSDPDNSPGTIHSIQTWVCGYAENDVYMIRCYAPDLITPAHFALRLRKNLQNIGTDIVDLRVMIFGTTTPPARYIRIVREDCLGQFHTHETSADGLQVNYVEAQRLYIQSNESFMATVTIGHEVYCSPA